MLLRERPEAACSEDTSSRSFDLHSSRLAGTSRCAQEDRVGDFGKLRHYLHTREIRNLFAIISQPAVRHLLVGRNAEFGYREDWKYPQRETVAFCVLGHRNGDQMGRNPVSLLLATSVNGDTWG